MAKMLIKPLTHDLDHVALEGLNALLSPGIDGFMGSVYKMSVFHFVPRPHHIYEELLQSPTESWYLALFSLIPRD